MPLCMCVSFVHVCGSGVFVGQRVTPDVLLGYSIPCVFEAGSLTDLSFPALPGWLARDPQGFASLLPVLGSEAHCDWIFYVGFGAKTQVLLLMLQALWCLIHLCGLWRAFLKGSKQNPRRDKNELLA